MWNYFRTSTLFLVAALIFCFFVGFYYTGLWSKGFEALVIAAILAVLEVSLSFDNAIVNAKVLKTMDPVWRHRFLTWGMLIAVFGMRFVFPLAIVSFAASVTPWEALRIALFEPAEYAKKMLENHHIVAAFGGSFLLLVALDFFYDENKEHHWIKPIEKKLALWGRIQALELFLVLLILLVLTHFMQGPEKIAFLEAGVTGVLCFVAVKAIEQILNFSTEGEVSLQRAGLASFIYLEVLDSSFSFDGVVGAFAITTNLLIIMAGLSIGAFFVRSLTIMFVEMELLSQFKYLEHGAFYAIALLAVLMLLDPFVHIPEWFTGLSGAIIIGVAYRSSLKASRLSRLKNSKVEL